MKALCAGGGAAFNDFVRQLWSSGERHRTWALQRFNWPLLIGFIPCRTQAQVLGAELGRRNRHYLIYLTLPYIHHDQQDVLTLHFVLVRNMLVRFFVTLWLLPRCCQLSLNIRLVPQCLPLPGVLAWPRGRAFVAQVGTSTLMDLNFVGAS